MAGGVTLNSPLNVNSSGGTGTSSMVGDLDNMGSQVKDQTEKFGGMLKDPNFNGQSEMSSMLKLQREVAQEQMMFQTVSNVMKARTDSAKNAISNMR